jgi:uncharacterized membrane protein YdbT with pleckstrin-like domain
VGYIERNLVEGEKVLYKTKLHWIVMLGSIVVALLLAAGGAALLTKAYAEGVPQETASAMRIGGIVAVMLALLSLIVGTVRRSATEMVVTNRRVLVKTGIGSRRTIEMMLAKIESIVVDESVMGRMLGYGTVVIRGTGGGLEPFERISNPNEFRKVVQAQIESLR